MSVLPDIPRLYTALAEWGACLVFILVLPRRRKGWKLVVGMAGAWAFQSMFLYFTGLRFTSGFSDVFWVLCMVLAVGIMFLLILSSSAVGLKDTGYCCIRAFVLAEFTASLEWQLHCYFWPDYKAPLERAMVLLGVVYIAVFLGAYWLEKKYMPKDGCMRLSRQELVSTVTIGVTVFAISNLNFLSINTPFSTQSGTGIQIVRTLVDIGGLAILYAQHIQYCDIRTQREVEAMKQVIQNQYFQYQQSKESVDLINRKYHDLKHQIAVLRAMSDTGRQNAYLDAMEEEIGIYEVQNKTGNPVLDTVLTVKSVYCIQHGITFTCVADGKLLEFMNIADICTIFGNTLDNAIEYVSSLSEKEKRLVHLSLSAQKGFVLLKVENYCESDLVFESCLPITTKGNTEYHGYGLKSVKHVAQKYGGSLTVQLENKWFEVVVLIPRTT